MKNFKLILTLFLALSLLLLSACKGGKGDPEKEKEDKTEETENLIYNASSELYFIVGASVDSSYASSIMSELNYMRGENLMQNASPTSEPHKHEIVLGNTDREISVTAISRLDRITKKSEDEIAFLVYSDGSSVAVVWEESERNEDGIMDEVALKYFLENYVKTELILAEGVAYSDAIDPVEDYYRPADEADRAAAWASFEKTYGKELADAFKALHGIYSSECIVWLANLYDSDICVCVDFYGESECKKTKYCGTGGFYFSNSGRDNRGYLPDAESTGQAIGLLGILGLADKRGGDPYNGVLTEDMRKKIGDFAYALEEPNGYFYHPQWSFELIDSLSSRRSRDMAHCEGILASLGRKPKYTTANGTKGEDVLGTSRHLSSRLGKDTVSAVSAVIVASSDSYDPDLQDLNSFKSYLSTLRITEGYSSYSIGNELTAMCSQIKERDRQIGTADNPTPLMDQLILWLNENQNPENGTWAYIKSTDPEYDPYMATNGLLKVSGVYKAHGVIMPYSKEAAISCIEAIMADAPSDRATDIYNLWYALINITDNLRAYGGAEGAAEADRITAELRGLASEAIILTRGKIAGFVRDDGSGSYYKEKSCPVSQGAPVAVSGPVEGDVNGTTIIVGQMADLIAGALDIPKVSIFGEAERFIFRDIVKNIGSVTKREEELPTVFDFETDFVGDAPEQLIVNGGTAVVENDTTGAEKGNILHLKSNSGSSQSVDIPVKNAASNSGVYVFESDFMVNSAEGGYVQQIMLGSCYMLTLRNVDGRLELWESSSQTNVYAVEEFLGIVVEPGKWFRLKVEYYTGDHDSVRIKVYADTDLSDGENMKLYAVTDNYYDAGGVKINKGVGTPSSSFAKTTILTLNSAKADIYLDNLNTYKATVKYEKPSVTDTPYINIDPPDRDRMTYLFNGNTIEGGLTSEGACSLSDGNLVIDGSMGGSLKAPVNVRTSGAKCASVGFDVTLSATKTGGTVTLSATDGGEPMFAYLLTVEEDGGGKHLSLTPVGAVIGNKVEKLRLPLDEKININVDYYHDEDRSIVYIDGLFVYSGTNLYSDANKGRMDGFGISVASGSGISLKIDNMFCEMTGAKFSDAVNSKVPSKIYEFDSLNNDVTLNGKGTVLSSYGGDAAVKMDSSNSTGSVSVIANKLTPVTNQTVIKFTLDYETSRNGVTHYIDINNSDNQTVACYALKVNGDKLELYEVGRGGVLKTPIYIYSSKTGVTVEIEIFTDKRTAYIVNGGKRVAKSGVLIGAAHFDSEVSSAVIRSGEEKSVAYIDSLQFETLYGVFENTAISGSVNNETDISSGLDFESSNSGNLPSFIKGELVSSEASLGISNVYNNVTEKYSNVLSFETAAGTNDKLNVVRPTPTSVGTATVFEADLMLDVGYEGYVYQIFFSDVPGGNHAYLIQLENRGGMIKITDNSCSNNNSNGAKNHTLYNGLNMGEWFNLRVEYYKSSSADSLRIKVFVNGTLVSVSDNFYGSENTTAVPSGRIDTVSFQSFLNNVGTLYVDNLKFADFNGSCTDSVGNK